MSAAAPAPAKSAAPPAPDKPRAGDQKQPGKAPYPGLAASKLAYKEYLATPEVKNHGKFETALYLGSRGTAQYMLYFPFAERSAEHIGALARHAYLLLQKQGTIKQGSKACMVLYTALRKNASISPEVVCFAEKKDVFVTPPELGLFDALLQEAIEFRPCVFISFLYVHGALMHRSLGGQTDPSAVAYFLALAKEGQKYKMPAVGALRLRTYAKAPTPPPTPPAAATAPPAQ